jgi:hypothetical protein
LRFQKDFGAKGKSIANEKLREDTCLYTCLLQQDHELRMFLHTREGKLDLGDLPEQVGEGDWAEGKEREYEWREAIEAEEEGRELTILR